MRLAGVQIRIEPNNMQRTMFAQHAGCTRFAYNWGVNVCQDAFANGEKTPSAIDLHKKLVAEVKTENPWFYESSKCAPQQALRNLESAYTNFHIRQKPSGYKKKKKVKRNGEDVFILEGLPQFKKKNIRDKFYLEGNFDIIANYIKVPYVGWLKCSENHNITDQIKNCTIRKVADEWYISYKQEKVVKKHNKKKEVGVDLGITALATLSDGKVFEGSKKLRELTRKLKHLQKSLSRKYKKGAETQSKNYEDTKKQIAILHRKIANHRKDGLHQLTTYLAKNHGKVTIEDLNVAGMMKNHKLAKYIANGMFYEFRRQMEYKGEWYGCEVAVADRWYASSKTCCKCGHKQDMPLKKRIFDCEKCDNKMDRDLNAAINLQHWEKNKKKLAASSAATERESPVERVSSGNVLPVALYEAGIKHQMS